MNTRHMALGILIIAVALVGPAWLHNLEAQGGANQSVGGGGVTVTTTLLDNSRDNATFQVALNTHSVNLDVYDFKEIVRLRDGRGGELAPTVQDVEGAGHHRRATVRFALPKPQPKSLVVVVKGVAGVPERVFRWTLD